MREAPPVFPSKGDDHVPMMKALREFTYAQQRRRAGDCFNVNSQQHVSALQEAKLAVVDADEGVIYAKPMTDEEAARYKTEFEQAGSDRPPPVVIATKRNRGRPKGSYKRKDLVAE